jgi:nitrite reductase (NADH) small subunit
MGKDTVQLSDFVENYAGGGIAQTRIVVPAGATSQHPMLPSHSQRSGPGEAFEHAGARDRHFVSVGRVGDLPDNGGICVKLGKLQIALFKTNGQVYAINNVCPHQGGALAEGELEGNSIMCPLHGWVYDITNGEVLNGEQSVDSYPVQVEGDDVKVCVPQ